jgi:hypothetical protein
MTVQIEHRLENQTSVSSDLINLLSQKVVDQSAATKAIVFYDRSLAAAVGSVAVAGPKLRADPV